MRIFALSFYLYLVIVFYCVLAPKKRRLVCFDLLFRTLCCSFDNFACTLYILVVLVCLFSFDILLCFFLSISFVWFGFCFVLFRLIDLSCTHDN